MATRATWRRAVRLGVGAGAAAMGVFLLASFYVELRYAHRMKPRSSVPEAPVALVFGAGLVAGGEPSPVLRQRMDTAMALYRAGKVKKLLVSGDNTDRYHDETKAMRRYAIDRGLPTPDVVGDYAGTSTWDTVYRAKAIFGVDRAILVTQDFHLPRALYLAHAVGIDAWGVAADDGEDRVWRYELRELLARVASVYLGITRPPARIMGEPVSLDPGAPVTSETAGAQE